MINLTQREESNPIISPDKNLAWQSLATFNPSPIKKDDKTYLLYRAMSEEVEIERKRLPLSTVGIAQSNDGVNFTNHQQLIEPSKRWDRFGCEDPRVTEIDGKYYIFYTALSAWPPSADGIKVGLAISENLKTITEKHLVTPFNAKAMTLFPEKINGKYVAILSANTDRPPAKNALATFDNIEDIWNQKQWNYWYINLDKNHLNLSRINSDQVEIGAKPIKIDEGWLLIYSHIKDYYSSKSRFFGIEAIILDDKNPKKIIDRTNQPILYPQENYEREGLIDNVTFPSGSLLEGDDLKLYYGGADKYCCLASLSLKELIKKTKEDPIKRAIKAKKYIRNPILEPSERSWENQAVFNPAVTKANKKIYLLYRALSADNTSTIGLAISSNGYNFKKLDQPIYTPRADFENKKKPNGLSGCEDPRITRIDNKYYILYTAFDSINPPRVAMSSIEIEDFENHNWNWSEPKLISAPKVDNKDACLFPEKINGKYIIIHREAGEDIAFDYFDDLEFSNDRWLEKKDPIKPRPGEWDEAKIGINTTPLKTKEGWLILYHGVCKKDGQYRVGVLLLDLKNPAKVIFRSKYPILEPTQEYEKRGIVDNVVFPCGKTLKDDKLLIYYGGADKVVGVAEIELKKLLKKNY